MGTDSRTVQGRTQDIFCPVMNGISLKYVEVVDEVVASSFLKIRLHLGHHTFQCGIANLGN